MTAIAVRPDWHADANCSGLTDVMFPSGQGGRDHTTSVTATTARAVAVCAECPVRAECAEAGADERFGVWGGIPRGADRHAAVSVEACLSDGSWWSARRIARHTGLTPRAVRYHLLSLETTGRIDRRIYPGPDPGKRPVEHRLKAAP